MIFKQAEILTELQPHQKASLKKALKHNLILAHSTGSGKTLTSIAIADALGLPSTVMVPAPLVENYKKELLKHKKDGPPVEVMSLPTAVSQNYQVPKGNTLIIDEAHSLRNPGTLRHAYMKQQAQRAGRVFALTGTPAYNNISDWASIVNIVAKSDIVPEDPSRFRKLFIEEQQINPGFWGRLRGVTPGVIERVKNKDRLKKLLSPYVDVFRADVEKPVRNDIRVDVPMETSQKALYRAVERGLPDSLLYKLQNNLPPSKSEAMQLNAFLTGVRQVSNTTQGYNASPYPDEELAVVSPKLKQALDNLKGRFDKDKDFKAFVYSNFKDSGVIPYSRLLSAAGIPHRIFDGSLSDKERKQLVEEYNTGITPVILGTGAASEGLDLKGTGLIQILEPHFNNSRIEQAIGRGIRYKSHAHLPEDKRKVDVEQYYSYFNEPPGFLSRLFGAEEETAVDNYLKSRSDEKQLLMQDFQAILEN